MDQTVIRPSTKEPANFKTLIDNKELLYFFIWRNFKVRYKQTLIGAAWAVFKPFILMVVFTIVFKRSSGISDGLGDIPYPVFSYTGLLFWSYFSQITPQVGDSIINMQGVIKKIYFPRILAPISVAATGIVDFFFSLVIFGGIMIYYGIVPEIEGMLLFVPLLLLTFAVVMGIGVFMATLNVKFRDVKHALPFFIQLMLFLTPVIYPVAFVPERFQLLLYVNPLTGVIDTARAALLGLGDINWLGLGISTAVTIVLLVFSLWFFRAREREFVDLV